MPSLRKFKYEEFAQSYIKQKGDPHATMKGAGYKWNSSYYTQLKNHPKIAGRIIELQRSVKNDAILDLEQRLVILSDIAKDPVSSSCTIIRSLHELHNQCGDNINKIDIDASIETNNIIRFVDVSFPKIKSNEDGQKEGLLEGQLEDISKELDEFEESNGLEDIFKEDGHVVEEKDNSPSNSHSKENLEDLENLDKTLNKYSN